jgi:hypothetical protein
MVDLPAGLLSVAALLKGCGRPANNQQQEPGQGDQGGFAEAAVDSGAHDIAGLS